MSTRAATVLRNATDGSILCDALSGALAASRRARVRMIAGLGGRWSEERARRATQTLEKLAAGSLTIRALSLVFTAPQVSWDETRTKRVMDSVIRAGLVEKFRTLGLLVIVAVMTHIAWLAAFGVRVHAVGWSLRAGLLLTGVLAFRRAEGFAAAWHGWRRRSLAR